MRKFLISLFLLLAFGLSACGSDANEIDSPGCGGMSSACTKRIPYKDAYIDCIVWEEGQGANGITCDFAKYHMENPK